MSALRVVLSPFRHRPGVTLAAVVTLGLGLGAATAGFAFVDALLLRPLPFPAPGRLIAIFETAPDQPRRAAAPANFVDWRSDLAGDAEMAGYYSSLRTLDFGAGAERVRATSVSAAFFPVLGARPAMGRAFSTADEANLAARLVVLSHATWQSLFDGDRAVVGRQVRIDDVSHEVIGVMPAGFRAPDPAGLWTLGSGGVPALAGFSGSLAAVRDIHYFRTVARLAPGVSLAVVEDRLQAVARRLADDHPATNRDLGVAVVPLRDAVIGARQGPTLILLGAVGLVLLVAVANTMNLLLTSTAGRWQEFTVRAALGASRRRLVTQLAAEGLVLALAAGLLGTALAALAVRWAGRASALLLPEITHAVVDGRVVAIGLGLATVTGILATLVPALRATTPEALGSLRAGRGIAGGRAGRLRSGLAVAQLGVSLTLLTGAGLLIKGYLALTSVNPGFRSERVVVLDVSLSRASYPAPDQVLGYYHRALATAAAHPDVHAAAAISNPPAGGGAMNRGFRIEGRPDPVRSSDQTINYQVASPGYFGLVGIPILAGRTPTEQDGPGTTPVAVINRAAAVRYWPGGHPLGTRLGFGRPDGTVVWTVVVGIVGDVRHSGLDQAPEPEVYVPMAQDPSRGMTLVLLTGQAPAAIAPLREAIRAADPSQPVSAPRALADQLSGTLARPRLWSTLLAGLATVALVMAAVGLYGLVTQLVQGRTRELGIRLALGAEPRQVMGMIIGGAARLTGLGVLLGVLGGLALTRVLTGMLFGVSAADPAVYAGTALLLLVVALAAAGIPARRAARLDPATVLSRSDS